MKELNLPVYRGDTKPKESGTYIVWERGSPRVLCLGWCIEAKQTDWRHGVSLIHVSAYAGPLPVRRDI